MILDVGDVHTYYGESHVLQGISLQIEEGEIVSLLGRNGVGKTTTLRTLMGLVPPRSGTVAFAGENITRLGPHAIAGRGLQLVPENRGIFPTLTVRDNLRVGAVAASDRARAERNAQRVFQYFPILRERASQLAGSLSGGEQQQLAIARSLMNGPRLLMLDEPCEGLAPMVVRTLIEAIREIRAGGTTVLLVEQNVHAALRIADRHYVMAKGKIVAQVTSAELEADADLRRRYLGVSAGA